MATSAPHIGSAPAARRAAGAVGWTDALYALGAVMLATEAAVHIQQFASLFHAVRWIGPLFLANAAACLLAAAALGPSGAPGRSLRWRGSRSPRARSRGLVLSYGNGLFGWTEAGWRTAIALAVVSELGAVVALAAGLAANARAGSGG